MVRQLSYSNLGCLLLVIVVIAAIIYYFITSICHEMENSFIKPRQVFDTRLAIQLGQENLTPSCSRFLWEVLQKVNTTTR